MVGVVVGVG
jgi:hypothetical protein